MDPGFESLETALADRYQIDREIGQGGMATVYLAKDLKHERQVAIKVLKPELAAVIGAERFLAEIRTTANLQHPHILPLFDSGEADGLLFYVMPFVAGESLRERLNREGQLPVDEAVGIARAVASGLDYAHRAGVVHRDIKPANILLQDGEPLVSDFGIALAISEVGSRMTETGLSVGTPHYMSPEQATGERTLGPRTDVYALGCVLYEALVGEPPFTGSTAQAILGKLLAERPSPIRRTRDTVPENVDAAVLSALAKTPADRFGTAAEFAQALTNPSFRPRGSEEQAGLAGRSSGRSGPGARIGWGAAGVAVILALWGWLRPLPAGPGASVVRYSARLPGSFTDLDQFYSSIALSPDARVMVLVNDGQLWLTDRSDLQGIATPLPGTEGAQNPFFSPDGTRIGFIHPTTSTLRTIPVAGGPATTIAEGVGRAGASWGPDGLIYLSMSDDTTGLASVPESGGEITVLTTLDPAEGETGHWDPAVLPDGRGVLFTVIHTEGPGSAEVALLDLAAGSIQTLTSGLGPMYARSGHLVYLTSAGTLMAAPFDRETLRLTGESRALLEGVIVGWRAPDLALSDDGTLMFTTSTVGLRPIGEPVWVSRTGEWEPIDPGWTGRFVAPTLSKDGRYLAFGEVRGGAEHIVVKQLDRGPTRQVSITGAPHYRAAWVPHTDSVAFVSVRGDDRDVFVGSAEGADPPVLLREGAPAINEVHFSPDGSWVVYRMGSGSTGQGRDLYGVPLAGDQADLVPLVTTEFEETSPAVSPDGRRLAYVSDRSGRAEVYVRPFPNTSAARWPVSVDGGVEPVWSHSGRELFYKSGGNLVSARLSPDTAFSIEYREVLFSIEDYDEAYDQHAMFDVHPDDQRFVMIRPLDGQGRGDFELVVIQNFFEALRQRVPN